MIGPRVAASAALPWAMLCHPYGVFGLKVEDGNCPRTGAEVMRDSNLEL